MTPLELTAAYAVFPTLGYRVRPRGIVVGARTRPARRVHQVHVEREQILSAAGRVPDGDDAAGRRRARHRRVGAAATASAGAIGGKTGIDQRLSRRLVRRLLLVGRRRRVGRASISRSAFAKAARARGSRCRSGPTSCGASRGVCRRAVRAARRIMRSEELCLISYQRPVEGCPTYVEYFKDGDEIPSRLCTIHSGQPEAAGAARGAGTLRRARPGPEGHLRQVSGKIRVVLLLTLWAVAATVAFVALFIRYRSARERFAAGQRKHERVAAAHRLDRAGEHRRDHLPVEVDRQRRGGRIGELARHRPAWLHAGRNDRAWQYDHSSGGSGRRPRQDTRSVPQLGDDHISISHSSSRRHLPLVREPAARCRTARHGRADDLSAWRATSPIAGRWKTIGAGTTTTCSRRTRWRRSAAWPAASRTTSTTC